MEDHKFRRNATGILMNTDHAGLVAYKARKKQSLRMDEVCEDINSLKQDLAEIKSALKLILKNR